MPAPLDQRKPILAGDLSDFDVRSLMSAFSLGRQVMTIEVLNARGSCDGRIVMQGGRVLSASAAGRSGTEAVRHLLKASQPARFQVLREAPETFSRVQHIGTLAEVTAEPRASHRLRPRADESGSRAEPRASTTPAPRTRVMEGSLSDFDVATILQVVSTARQHTVMEVVDLAGKRSGAIQLKAGMVVCAEAGVLEGVAAVRQLLRAPTSYHFTVFREPEQGAELALLGPVDEVLLRASEFGSRAEPRALTDDPPPPPRRSGVHRAVASPPAPPRAEARPQEPPKEPSDPRADASELDEDEVTTISDRRSVQPLELDPQPVESAPVLDGCLRDFDLCSVLQVAGISRQLTSVRICDAQRQPVGEVHLQGGQILAIGAYGHEGLAALRLLLHSPRDFLFTVLRHAQSWGPTSTTHGSVFELLQQASASPLPANEELRFGPQAGSVVPGEQRRRSSKNRLGAGVVLAAAVAAGALLALRQPREEGAAATGQTSRPNPTTGPAGAAALAASPAASPAQAALSPTPSARVGESAIRPGPQVEPVPRVEPVETSARQRTSLRGRSPAEIASMQGGLKLLGFHPGPVDGVIGPLTRTAVAAFQRAEGLLDDGDLSRATEARLQQRIRSPAH